MRFLAWITTRARKPSQLEGDTGLIVSNLVDFPDYSMPTWSKSVNPVPYLSQEAAVFLVY
jgi:hypothetical protein